MSEIEEHKREIVFCVECLDWFVEHTIAGMPIHLPIPDLNNLIDTFIDHLSRIEEILEEAVDDEYCSICVSYSFKVKDKRDSFLPKILSTFHRILERGSKKKLSDNIVLNLLMTLKNISFSPSTSTRSSIFTLIKLYVKDWLRIYNDSECYGKWMTILSQITLSSDNESPNTSLCSETWPLFHPVLDVVKREFVGDKIVEDDHEECLRFFSNLCCDPSHALVIYDNVKHLLDGWFEVMKKKEHEWGIKYWFNLISMLSAVLSLVPHLSPKYDAKMEWCKEEWYCSTQIYNQYLSNISSFVSSSYLSSTLFHSVPMVSFLPSIETSLCPEKDGYSYASHVCSVMNLHKTIPHRKNNTSLCSETWPLFHPVLDVVKREFVGDKIVEDDHEECLRFFSNLCCDPEHTPEIYDNVKDLLDAWWRVMKMKQHKWGIKYLSRLISMLSTVTSLVPQLSPKYDAKMEWCKEEWYCSTQIYNQYLSNISSFVSSSYLSSTLFHSVPMVSFLPSIETSLCPEKDGYSYASHVCSVMNLHKTIPHRKNKISCYHDIISGKEMQIQHVLKRDGSSSQDILTHSSLIQYTSPPQHMLVKMPFDDERSLRQSVYDLIEHTGGGVEVMFEQGSLCCSFEEYDQEAWRIGMEDIEEEEESEEYYIFLEVYDESEEYYIFLEEEDESEEEEYASDISVDSFGD
ncbi:hypothetical protein ADUPG1_013657 [Aduncisulcus paluster]|uniref:Uncharacterized protein n=1 Tax=Aduncisulcus paluster TaxID=2918883 RepID=A0ABQ5K3N3_9EUKA|nr:hypothetical protein ADUPG1_013657 [Aduncisulcus paluster]